MGAWGTNIFDNDTALDVRDTLNHFRNNVTNLGEAFEKTLNAYRDEFDNPDVVYALSYLSISCSCLTNELKDKTLELIDWEIKEQLAGWRDPEDRKKVLLTFKSFIEIIETFK